MSAKQKETREDILARVGEDLFNYSLEREDIKLIAAGIPEEAVADPDTVEYELQILKFISVGWSFAYYLRDKEAREFLSFAYWEAVRDLCSNLSQSTGLLIGEDIDYFRIIKERLSSYVSCLEQAQETRSPAAVIGPEFARLCGDREDVFCVHAGTKLFVGVLERVREYLQVQGMEIQDPEG
ncbi:MAG: hypothetical protein ACLFSY_02860 [Desulfonatronovibrionaceae bacterium]